MAIVLFSLIIGLGMAAGDFFMNKWMILGNSWQGYSFLYWLVAMIFYVISLTGYGYFLKSENLNTATTITVTINIVAVVIIGTLFVHEQLSTLQILATTFCVLGLVLLLVR